MVMKFARLILLVSFTTLASGATAQNDAPDNSIDAMHRCQTFSDCVLVYGCTDDAINKLYDKQYKRPESCTITKAHSPKSIPTCEEGRCVAIDITKEDGQ
jgi:hypothetical protein